MYMRKPLYDGIRNLGSKHFKKRERHIIYIYVCVCVCVRARACVCVCVKLTERRTGISIKIYLGGLAG